MKTIDPKLAVFGANAPPTEETYWQWFAHHAGVHVVAILLALGAKVVLFKVFDYVASKTSSTIDDAIVRMLKTFFSTSVMICIGLYGLELWDPITPAATKALLSAAIMAMAMQCAATVKVLFEEVSGYLKGETVSREISGAANAVVRCISIVIYAMGLLLAFDNMGFKVTSLVAGFGLSGMAVGFAAEATLRDLLAAVALFLDRPLSVGEAVKVDAVAGIVESIGLRSTQLRAFSGQVVVIPNSSVAGAVIRNFMTISRQLTSVEFCISASTPDDKVVALPGLVQSACQHQVAKVEMSDVYLKGWKPNALVFEVWYTILSGDVVETRQTKSHLNMCINEVLKKEGINPPFPLRVVLDGVPDHVTI